MTYAVQFAQLPSIPLAVVRRQARASDLARVVPECCGLVWDLLRGLQIPAGPSRVRTDVYYLLSDAAGASSDR
jgi:hypothetical protein